MRMTGAPPQPMGLVLLRRLSVSSCAAHVEPKCKARAPAGADSAAAQSRPEQSGSKGGRATPDAAADVVAKSLAAIPRPASGQFRSPELVLRFLFEKVSSRDVAGSLAAF